MTTTTRLEKVLNGQSIRPASSDVEFRRVTSHKEGLCHGIAITFPDGSSLTGMPKMPVEIETLGD